MSLKKLITESTDEEIILHFLKEKISGTEWENKVFLVGGAVRDEIMGKSAKDLDFVINGDINSGIDFSTWLSKELGIFKLNSNPVIYPKFGTAKLSLLNNKLDLPDIELEFVAPRIEKYTSGSRNPEVSGGELIDDVMRRDLTINSLMKNISNDEIIDLTGNGISDIKNGIIRTPNDSDITFKDDPLRMLRAIRFTVKYGFDISKELLQSIQKNAELINTISNERIKDELNKIITSPKPDKGIRLLKISGLLKHIIGEFDDAIGMRQNVHHTEDVFKHSMSVLKNTPPELNTRLIALFHDIGKVLTKTVSPEGSVHFYGHEMESANIVKDVMRRLKYPNKLIDSVSNGVEHHMKLKHGGDDATKLSDKSLRKFLNAVGDNLESILDVIHADNIAHSDESAMKNQIDIVRNRISKLDKQIDKKHLKLPINGKDLIQMGFKPSPLMGKVLTAIEDAWYDNPEITRDEAISIAKQFKLDDNINEIRKLL
jgi:poly(A) polymerase